MKEKEHQEKLIDQQMDEAIFKHCHSSATECTGLKYRPADSLYEEESYDEIYHFLPPSDTFE
ncbi:MAG: hypothetical protein UHS41_04755 [Lachnospiraceae bacterium]|nr:hypothetical protein [Lachnospiraceae bacterium]